TSGKALFFGSVSLTRALRSPFGPASLFACFARSRLIKEKLLASSAKHSSTAKLVKRFNSAAGQRSSTAKLVKLFKAVSLTFKFCSATGSEQAPHLIRG
ncbi:MAG: hypothetical protein LH470_03620, partial [Lysobacter sp.]|nr:hypothetical protein [Lysobacter sp.]